MQETVPVCQTTSECGTQGQQVQVRRRLVARACSHAVMHLLAIDPEQLEESSSDSGESTADN